MSEVTDIALDRLAALGLAEMLAIRREPGEAYMLPSHVIKRIDLVDVFRDVQRVRMIGCM